ncbi:hypothetical protein [Actinophytocola sp.]|uniref:hypothetical protein n=1 Tax=Actinophytocola sp. TaxID=1872138 RepID=UPI0025BA62DA|nr:hypothetical protein [Actinophytocola sp.]
MRSFAGLPSGRGSSANRSRWTSARSALNPSAGAEAGAGSTPRSASALPPTTAASTSTTTSPTSTRRGGSINFVTPRQ